MTDGHAPDGRAPDDDEAAVALSSATFGRESLVDPLVGTPGSPGPAAHGLCLAAVGDAKLGVWQLLDRQLDTLERRRDDLTVARFVVDTVEGDAVCEHHDVSSLPTFLLYDGGKLTAARTGAVNLEILDRFARR